MRFHQIEQILKNNIDGFIALEIDYITLDYVLIWKLYGNTFLMDFIHSWEYIDLYEIVGKQNKDLKDYNHNVWC